MRIKKLQLKNGYKRFHDLTIDLGDNPARIVALIGKNGCGKSSVLDAMMFHANAYGPVGNKGGKDYMYHSMNQMPNFSHQNVVIDFVSGNFTVVRNKKASEGKEQTLFSLRSPYRYNSSLKISQITSVSDIRLNNYGASTSLDIDDKMENNYRRLYAKLSQYLREDKNRSLKEAEDKIISDLNASLASCLDLVISDIGDVESDKGTLYFSKPDHSKEFGFDVLSSGEKEVVDILLDLYLRKDEYSHST